MNTKRKIELTEISYDRIVSELIDAKSAIEYYAKEEGFDCEDTKFENNEEWKEICKALEELGA